MNKKVIIGGVAAVAVVALAGFFFSGKKETKVSLETATIINTTISSSITATGTIEPVTSVTVGTQVSGIVSHLYVDYNSVVKKGQVIAELDKTNLISDLSTQKANWLIRSRILTVTRLSSTRDLFLLMTSRMQSLHIFRLRRA